MAFFGSAVSRDLNGTVLRELVSLQTDKNFIGVVSLSVSINITYNHGF